MVAVKDAENFLQFGLWIDGHLAGKDVHELVKVDGSAAWKETDVIKLTVDCCTT